MFRKVAALSMLLAGWSSAAFAQEPQVQDPTRPPVVLRSEGSVPEAVESLRLTGVLVSDSRRIAVINGRFYRVGDRVNGDEITRIEPGSIRIKRGGEQMLVTVQQANAVDKDGDPDK